MEEKSAAFTQKLSDALSARAAWLETAQIPALGQAMRSYRSLFESIIDMLMKKGLLRDDPYEFERPPDVIVPPSDASIPDTEEGSQMSTRMTAYRRRLEYVSANLPLSLASLTLEPLRKLMTFFSYMDWSTFSDATRSPTTRVLARLVAETAVGADPLAARVMKESRDQLKKAVKDINARLALVEAWQRESWKARLRAKVSIMEVKPGQHSAAEKAAEIDAFKAACDSTKPPLGWHPDLVQEILAEERGEDAAARQEKLLASLAVPVANAPQEGAAMVALEALRETTKSLSKLPSELQSAEAILVENERALRAHARGLLQRIRNWLSRIFGEDEDRRYVIEIRETPESPPEKETVVFLRFLAQTRETGETLAAFGVEGSPAFHRLKEMSQDQLCDFLDQQVRDLHVIRRTMEGLNTLFHVRAVKEGIAAARSIKMELLAIENAVVRADTARKESIAAFVAAAPPAPEPTLDRLT